MKGFYLFLALFCSALFVTGCSTDIAGVFDDNNHRAIQPVDELAELNSYPGINFLVRDVYNTSGQSLLGEGAIVVNRPEMLKEVVMDDEVFTWPEIDLSQYSLVIGRYAGPDSGYYLANQRVIKEGKKVKLYAEIKHRIGFGHATTRVFVALYPKLPDGEVEFVRWNNY